MRRFTRPLPLLAALLAAGGSAGAQEHQEHTGGRRWSLGAQAVPLLTHAAPAMAGESYTEAYLTQPMVMGHARLPGGRAEVEGVLNLEGLTLRRGELNAGIWGEGYVDRRHPHTYLHELMGTLRLVERPRLGASLSAGKGFVPFGTDDPMARPFVKYPANHHLAQVLERTVATGAVRAGPLTLEGAVFNGNEPTGPADHLELERFGDSWAARLTARPLEGVEAQASWARVESPELAAGGGLDQQKRSASVRLERARHGAGAVYVLLEWARTDEYDDGRRGNGFGSWLGEGAVERGGVRLALRYERTERPEEERLLDPFRTPQPHSDVHLLGITRWSILTGSVSREVAPLAGLRLRPFAEAALLGASEKRRPSLFVPERVYGSDRMWSLSAGTRIEVGARHARMGRYGAARPFAPAAPPPTHHHP